MFSNAASWQPNSPTQAIAARITSRIAPQDTVYTESVAISITVNGTVLPTSAEASNCDSAVQAVDQPGNAQQASTKVSTTAPTASMPYNPAKRAGLLSMQHRLEPPEEELQYVLGYN